MDLLRVMWLSITVTRASAPVTATVLDSVKEITTIDENGQPTPTMVPMSWRSKQCSVNTDARDVAACDVDEPET
jgi:hypothetical protein